ncbi:hypothetical protein B0H12DRAFT_1097607 [Mycena haematopus]|nr:hypothetical protein B0H12DRAFT_1097607 [Mycena haematopus]
MVPSKTMSSTSQEPLAAAQVSESGENVPYVVFDLMAQTFVFGLYTLLFCLSTRTLLKRKSKTRVNRIMLLATVFMYLLSAAYWAYTIVYAADLLHRHIDVLEPLGGHDEISHWLTMLNAIVMINFVISDCVVFWRAWAISHHSLRNYLWVTMGLVILTAVAVGLTIAFRTVAFLQSPTNHTGYIKPAIDFLQVSTGMLTLLVNLSATAIVGLTAWRHHRVLRNMSTDEKDTRSGAILALIVEGGAFYCLSALILVLGALIRLPYGTIGDLYGPIHLHIAGAYPPAVILLANMNRRPLSEKTILDSTFSGSSPLHPLQFASADVSPSTTIRAGSLDMTAGSLNSKQPRPTTPTPKQLTRSRFSEMSFDLTPDVQ